MCHGHGRKTTEKPRENGGSCKKNGDFKRSNSLIYDNDYIVQKGEIYIYIELLDGCVDQFITGKAPACRYFSDKYGEKGDFTGEIVN